MARRRAVGLALAALLLASSLPTSSGECTCPVVAKLDGWCELHAVGYIAGLQVRTQLLFEALDAHGHEFYFRTFDCAGCRRASASDGYCDEHRLGFVGGLAYFSRLTYLVARARNRSGSAVPCSECRAVARSGGWCDACGGAGFAGPVVFRERRDYDDVSRALDLVRRADAVGKRCEHCAAAMATDGICPKCRLEYRNGEAHPFVPRAPSGPGAPSPREPARGS